jgi:hypothetical protein
MRIAVVVFILIWLLAARYGEPGNIRHIETGSVIDRHLRVP